MTFFYDLNKRLDSIRATPETTHKQLNERNMSKSMTDEGNAFAKAVVDAKRDGIQPGEKIKVGGKEMPLKEKMSPAKQKSFAALAPPKDKITFADKIAGAKKEVDEMLGDVAAEAMKAAVGKMQVTDESRHDDDEDDVYAYQDPSKKKTHKTASGGTVTRHGGVTRHAAAPGRYGGYDPETDPDKDEEKPDAPAGEKRRGRPKGVGGPKQERVTAKSRKTDRTAHGQAGFKKEKKVKESDEYGDEGDMAKDDLRSISKAAAELNALLNDHDDLPEWVQSKITKALDYINTSNQYMDQEKSDNDSHDNDQVVFGDEELDEKATSKAQRRAAAIAMHAPKSKLKGASKEMSKMPKKELEKFASTKEKGLPNKKEKTEETTSAGSVATSTAAPKGGKGGVQFGKGIYESLESQLRQQLNEEMSVNMSIGTDGRKSVTVTATDEDADQLAQILNLAGLQGHGHGAESCPTCGEAPCGCAEVVDENAPDYPQNMGQESDTNFMTKTIAGGLNKEKYTGQSTIPVLASQGDRQHAYENVELERSLFKLYQEVKSK